MIPPFNEHGELPVGIYEATPTELRERFGWNQHRRRLLTQLGRALRCLKDAGVDRVYVGGSAVTAKGHPNDIDAYWVPEPGYDKSRLSPEFFEEDGTLAGRAEIPGLDLCPDYVGGILGTEWLGQVKGHPERRKGVVLVRLGHSSVSDR